MTDNTQSSSNKDTNTSPIEEAVVIEEKAQVVNKTTENQNAKEKSPKATKTAGLWVFSVFNFILIILICAAAYWYYTQIAGDESEKQNEVLSLRQQLDDQTRSTAGLLSQINNQNQVLETRLQDLISRERQNTDNSQAAIDTNADTLSALTKRLGEMSGRRPSDWLLAEANYLVNMASRKLYIEKDVRTAMTLLKEADARLSDLNDPSLFPVRALISADVQTLQQINPTSTNSIALAISGLLPQISELALDKLQLPEKEQEDLSLSEDVSDWRENLSLTWQAIVGDLISIDYADEPLEPYIAERQQWLIEQQLKHALSMAQTAALNEQVELYRAAMQQAIAMLVENYQLDDPKVSQHLGALQELQNLDFSRNYPSSLQSQASLQEVIERRVQSLFNNNPVIEEDSDNQL